MSGIPSIKPPPPGPPCPKPRPMPPTRPPKDEAQEYAVPLTAEEFLSTAKKIACEHRLKHPEPLDKDLTIKKFMLLDYRRTPVGYRAKIRSATLDSLIYIVVWSGEAGSYNLEVYRKIDHDELFV